MQEIDSLISTLQNRPRVRRQRIVQDSLKLNKRGCMYRQLSILQQKQIILLRYGAISNVSVPIRSTTQVAHKLNLNVTTVINVCNRYIDNGKQVVNRRRNSGRKLS
jgi:hypothetical protein